jgi:hypothetical protein
MKNEVFLAFIRYKKRGLFSIGCYQMIPKIIIGIGGLKIVDTNKCTTWPISKTLLVSTGLSQPTLLSPTQIKNIIWIRYETCIFSHSEFTVKYTQDIHKNIHTTSLEFTVNIHNIDKFNSQIVYSQHRSKSTIFITSVINIHVVFKYINRNYSSKTKSFIIA